MGNAGAYSSTNLYGLGSVCASGRYGRGATGDGIDIAVLDTGISVSGATTDLNDINANLASFVTGKIINSDNVPQDDDSNCTNDIGCGHDHKLLG